MLSMWRLLRQNCTRTDDMAIRMFDNFFSDTELSDPCHLIVLPSFIKRKIFLTFPEIRLFALIAGRLLCPII